MEFVIEDDVPLPGRAQKYPFDQLSPGQSFVIPNMTSKKITGTVAQFARRKGWTLMVRAEGDGVRVWRGADPTAEELAARRARAEARAAKRAATVDVDDE